MENLFGKEPPPLEILERQVRLDATAHGATLTDEEVAEIASKAKQELWGDGPATMSRLLLILMQAIEGEHVCSGLIELVGVRSAQMQVMNAFVSALAKLGVVKPEDVPVEVLSAINEYGNNAFLLGAITRHYAGCPHPEGPCICGEHDTPNVQDGELDSPQ